MARIEKGDQIEFHFGVNYVISPAPTLTQKSFLAVQERLTDAGLSFGVTKRDERAFVLTKESQSPTLQLQIASDPANPVGQFLVIEPTPASPIEHFIKKTDACISAFKAVWPSPFQILKRDTCIRQLYECRGADHAFRFLWEERLHQTGAAIAGFKKKIGGGGLRLVFPPESPDQPMVEVKVESLLANPKRLFIESQFTWQQPLPAGSDFDAADILRKTYNFALREVVDFITAEE